MKRSYPDRQHQCVQVGKVIEKTLYIVSSFIHSIAFISFLYLHIAGKLSSQPFAQTQNISSCGENFLLAAVTNTRSLPKSWQEATKFTPWPFRFSGQGTKRIKSRPPSLLECCLHSERRSEM